MSKSEYVSRSNNTHGKNVLENFAGLDPGAPSCTFMPTYALGHSISVTVNDTAARRLLLSTDVGSGVEIYFRALMIIPAQFCVSHRKEKSCIGFRRQILMCQVMLGELLSERSITN